ncbi:MAG TPA: cytochrome C, partial [Aquabacterium sp.]|nr:cytochrome C [Aquabacterium sp.]
MSVLELTTPVRRLLKVALTSLAASTAILSTTAHAIPLFNRQTGQNCMACHAGGQFPELTPYGRLFKMTGYTLGKRTDLPLSAMVVASMSSVANTTKSDSPRTDFSRNDAAILATASLFAGGKISDNVGAFVQITHDPYASLSDSGRYQGKTQMDNVDLRYADRVIEGPTDFIWGVSLNNNPSVSDPWNTAPAWMQYVPVPSPTSSAFIDGNTPYPGYGAGSN